MSKLDHEHNEAIRAEIGERLGTLRKPEKLPTRFRHLIDRLAKVDYKIEKKTVDVGWLRRLLTRLRHEGQSGPKRPQPGGGTGADGKGLDSPPHASGRKTHC